MAAGALSLTAAAYQQPPPGGGRGGQQGPPVVEVEKLKDNLFVLRGEGGGGNTAVFVMANGVAVVDTKNPGWGQPILAKIKELTPKPVTMIVNTHTHGDHVSGNVEFPATVDVVVHENTAANMKKMTGRGSTPEKPVPSIFEQNKGRGLPKRTFKDRMTIGSGADQIDLHYFGRGHTNGDAWVLFPALRVVHAGDIFSGKNLPLLDANNGGSGVEIGNTPGEGAQRAQQERRHDHHRPQRAGDDERSAGVRAVQPRFPGGGATGEEGGPERRGSGQGLDDAREVHGLRGASGDPGAGELPGDLQRDQVVDRRS